MKQKRVLLVEPKTRTSYPPLGLMKIATYHKLRGDYVKYVIGTNRQIVQEQWDKIYITSVFTYDFNKLIETVRYYVKNNPYNFDKIQIGGVSASLLHKDVEKATNIKPHIGLLDEEDEFLNNIANIDLDLMYLHDCCPSIDNLPPDFSIFPENTKYKKMLDNSFVFYTTKGCPNKCAFCAVDKLEPKFVDHVPLTPRIKYLRDRFGDRAGLLLLDNNIAASPSYDRIIDEIRDCGYGTNDKICTIKNGRKTYKNRFVDFNQGVDLRLLDRQKMRKMAEIAINPLRLAFDHVSLANEYDKKARMAIDCGVLSLSNYMLYNFHDDPDDIYKRFMVNIEILKDNPHAKIFSFPMRYSPIYNKDRKHIGEKWTKREVRAFQIILNATHGIVSHKRKFFFHAFGNDVEHFRRILLYPYHYILNREFFELKDKRIEQWEREYASLTSSEASEFHSIIKDGILYDIPASYSKNINNILEHYKNEHAKIIT